jgi:hypothetical protein
MSHSWAIEITLHLVVYHCQCLLPLRYARWGIPILLPVCCGIAPHFLTFDVSLVHTEQIIMSLEEKLAALTMADAPLVVEAVKKDGVEKSGLAANISVLVARCDAADDNDVLAALNTVKALAKDCPQAQAFTKETLGVCK